ncbi:hypothetical protein QQ045_013227 [Rhodiola kirilowii]
MSFDPKVVKEGFLNYFKGLLNGNFRSSKVNQQLFEKEAKVSESDCIQLIRHVSWHEITQIVKDMPNNKAVGPFGFNAEFFKASWQKCGRDMLESIQTFSRDGKMHGAGAC